MICEMFKHVHVDYLLGVCLKVKLKSVGKDKA